MSNDMNSLNMFHQQTFMMYLLKFPFICLDIMIIIIIHISCSSSAHSSSCISSMLVICPQYPLSTNSSSSSQQQVRKVAQSPGCPNFLATSSRPCLFMIEQLATCEKGIVDPRIRKVGQLGGAPYLCILIIQGGAWQSEIPKAILRFSLTSPGLNCFAFDSSSFPSQQVSPKTVNQLLVWYLKKASCSTEYSMSIFPSFGFMRSLSFSLTIFCPSRQLKGSRSLLIPVASMNSGSLNIGFKIPLFVCKNLDFWFQCRGTGIVFLRAFISHKNKGSEAVISQAQTRSGLLARALRSATFSQRSFFRCERETFASAPSAFSSSPAFFLSSSDSSPFSSSAISKYLLDFS